MLQSNKTTLRELSAVFPFSVPEGILDTSDSYLLICRLFCNVNHRCKCETAKICNKHKHLKFVFMNWTKNF